MRTNGLLLGAALAATAIIASPGAAEAQTTPTLTTLYSFSGASYQLDLYDGAFPQGALLVRQCFGFLGRPVTCLYGTTAYGGADRDIEGDPYDSGTVFKLTPDRSGRYGINSESVLHSFDSASEGTNPVAGLIADASGALYGTAEGRYGPGDVFKLTPDGSGGYTESALYSFTGGSDGANPEAGLIADAAGALYGTTAGGGAFAHGTVFKLTPNGAGGYSESVLHAFAGGSDGANPQAGLIADASGALYGTTSQGGGSPNCASGCGTVFKLTPNGSGGYGESVLHSFTGSDGATPAAGLIVDASGALYGTTKDGGAHGYGTAFKLARGFLRFTYAESVLYSFTGASDGANPQAGLIADAAGALYGTAASGGEIHSYCALDPFAPSGPCGVVFKLTPNGSGGYGASVLHSFNGSDGFLPVAGLSADASGALYGTTVAGGGGLSCLGGCGTVFKLTGAGFAVLP